MRTRGVVALALVVACDQGVAPSAAGPAAPSTPGADCADLTAAILDYTQNCTCLAGATAAAKRFENECELVRLAPGATGVDAALATCTKAFRDALAHCDGVGVACTIAPGTRLGGAPCGADAQCASGVCNAPIADAEAVLDGVPAGMASGFVTNGGCGTCSASTAPSVATRQLEFANARCCAPHQAGRGEACSPLCPGQGGCLFPYACHEGTCVDTVPAGEACNACSDVCEPGLACSGDCRGAQPNGTCGARMPTPPPHADGESCGAGDLCDVYAQCIDGKCALFDPRSCN